MTFHSRTYRPAKGTARTNKMGHRLSTRVVVCIPQDDFKALVMLAELKDAPLSMVIREAVRAYVEARR